MQLVVGNTELGVEVKFKHCEYPIYINPVNVPELTAVTVDDNSVTFGASVTLTEIENTCLNLINSLPEEKVRILKEIVAMLQWFAGKQTQF